MSGFGERLSQRQKARTTEIEGSNKQLGCSIASCEAFKKGVDADDARRKREDAAVQLRKQTRDEADAAAR